MASDKIPPSSPTAAQPTLTPTGSAAEPPPQPSEFEQITQKIDEHKRVIDTLKKKIVAIQGKCPKSGAECQELQCLRCCLNKEMTTLNCIIQRAIDRESTNPGNIPWGVLTMPTTLEEDANPHVMFYPPETMTPSPAPKTKRKRPSSKADEGDAKSVADSTKTDLNKGEDSVAATETEDEIDHEQLQANIRYRDMMINCLQQKMRCLNEQMIKLSQERNTCQQCPGKAHRNTPSGRMQKKICCPALAAKQMEENTIQACGMQEQLEHLGAALEKLQLELKCVQKERNELVKYKKSPRGSKVDSEQEETDELLHQYNTLLCQYTKKDREVKFLQDKLAQMNASNSNGEGGESVEKAQIGVLNERIKEFREEEEEFKLHIAEQQQQINDYRAKFLQAQQTVIEQRTMIEGIESNKQQIDAQIKAEVNRIKLRFQDKLKELAALPKLLECEQFKVKTLQGENDDLAAQINSLNIQLRKLRKDIKRVGNEGGSGDSKRNNAELNGLKKSYANLEKQNRELVEQLKIAQSELETIMKEADRHLNRTKERTESTKEALQSSIDKLEIELAEARAKSVMKLAERDEEIQCVRNQLRELSQHFVDAQLQIKSLTVRMGSCK